MLRVKPLRITSIKEIAYDCGFTDPLYFSKAFKRQYGNSPSDFLQQSIINTQSNADSNNHQTRQKSFLEQIISDLDLKPMNEIEMEAKGGAFFFASSSLYLRDLWEY